MVELIGMVLAIVGVLFAFETPRRRFLAIFRRAPRSDLIKLIQDRSDHVHFFHSPPIDIRTPSQWSGGRLTCRLDNRQIRLGLPANWPTLVEEVIAKHDQWTTSSPTQLAERRAQLNQRVKDGGFLQEDSMAISSTDPKCETLCMLLSDGKAIEEAKRSEFKDYLLGESGFLFNGQLLSVSRFKSLRTATEHPEFEIVLSITDYYTYRIISRFAKRIRVSRPIQEHGTNFSEYLAAGVQLGIHFSLGLAIIVHTLRDERAIITRRSGHATNTQNEAGRYFMSANEATILGDVAPGGSSIDLYSIVERALKEELLGAEPQDAVRELLSRIKSCLMVGAYLYLPNMSIGPCIYVGIDCDSSEIRSRHRFARDGNLETSGIIREERWDKTTGLPRFSTQGVREFVEQTILSGRAHEHWDEGALCALVLAVHGAHASKLCN